MYKYTQMLSEAYRCNNVQTDMGHLQHKKNIVPRKYENSLSYGKIPIQNQKSFKENQNNFLSTKPSSKIVNKKLQAPNTKVFQPNRDRNNVHQQRVQEISNKYSHQGNKESHNNYEMYKLTKAQKNQPDHQRNPDMKKILERTYIQMGGSDKSMQPQNVYHNRQIPFSDQISKGKVKEQIAFRLQNLRKNDEKHCPDRVFKKYDYGCMPQAGPHNFGQNPSNSNQTMTKLSLLQERIKQTIEPYKNL